MSVDNPPSSTAEVVPVGYAPAEKPRDRWGKGFLATTASILLPGLGHLIAGRRRRAGFWFLACLGVGVTGAVCVAYPSTWLAGVALGAIEILCVLSMCVDAFVVGRRSDRRMLGRPWLRYLVGIACIVAISFADAVNPRLLLACHLRDHYVQGFQTGSGAMRPTLLPGDCFVAHKRADVRRWNMVLFEHPQFGPGVRSVSRVVGLPGETIEITNGQIQVDGRPVTPPAGLPRYASQAYIGRQDFLLRGKPGAGCEGNPISLGPDEYYVLGDNTTSALDSRLWEIPAEGHQLGALPGDHIIGRVTAVYWPPSRWRLFGD